MKAMIFAAGLGTRLKPLTDHLPKALVRVGDTTLLDLTIRRLIAAGATELVVNVHHFAQQIIAYLAAATYPISIEISDESRQLLDTGGGLRQATSLFTPTSQPILIHNVDILHNADLKAFYRAGQEADVLLMVSRRPSSRRLLFDERLRLVGWTNTQTGEVRSPIVGLRPSDCQQFAFSGIHCFSPRVFPLMNDYPAAFPIMDFYINRCASLAIRGYVVDDLQLLDVGKTQSLAAAQSFLAQLGGNTE